MRPVSDEVLHCCIRGRGRYKRRLETDHGGGGLLLLLLLRL